MLARLAIPIAANTEFGNHERVNGKKTPKKYLNLKRNSLPTASKIHLANRNRSLLIHVKIAQQNTVIETAAGVYEFVRFDFRN